jgi:hypothetical protein
MIEKLELTGGDKAGLTPLSHYQTAARSRKLVIGGVLGRQSNDVYWYLCGFSRHCTDRQAWSSEL